MFETKDMLTLVDYKKAENPVSRLTLEVDSNIELYYLRFNIVFPEAHTSDYGIYILPANNIDDTNWSVRYADRNNAGSGTGGAWITPKPFLATVGWGKPTACIGEAILVNEGVSPFMYLKTHYTRTILDYSYISQLSVMSASNIPRNPYDALHIVANKKTFLGEISIYKDSI